MTYDLNHIRPLILEIIATKPEGFVYEPIDISIDPEFPEAACRYRDNDGKPSCIVGHLFDKLGVVATNIEGRNARNAADAAGVVLDQNAAYYLVELQNLQDQGTPWAAAEAEAFAATI